MSLGFRALRIGDGRAVGLASVRAGGRPVKDPERPAQLCRLGAGLLSERTYRV